MLTGEFYKNHKDWSYPYWIKAQTDKDSKYFSPLSYDPFLINKTFRNWTVISPPDFDEKCIIDPWGSIIVGKDSFTISVAIKDNDTIILPDELDNVNVSYDYENNSYIVEYGDMGTQTIEVYAKKNIYLINSKFSFKNFIILVRPFNPEGVSPIHSIRVKKNYVNINDQRVLEINNITKKYLSDYQNGDVINLLKNTEPEEKKQVNDPYGFCTAAFETDGDSFTLYPVKYKKIMTAKKHGFDFKNDFEFKINSNILNKLYNTQKNYLLSFCTKDGIFSGAFTDSKINLNDYDSLIPALDIIGENGRAESYLKGFKIKKLPIKILVKYLWTLLNHYSVSKPLPDDEKFKETLFSAFKTINNIRNKSKKFLLPPSKSNYKFELGKKHIRDDLWALSTYKLAYNLFENDNLKREYLSYFSVVKEELNNYFEKTKKRIFFEDQIFDFVNLLYPETLFDYIDPIISNTVDEIKSKYLSNGILFNPHIEGYDILNTLKLMQILLIKNDNFALTLLDNILKISNKTMSFPKSINPLTLGGLTGDGHYSPVSAEIINFIANIFGYSKIENEIHLFKIAKSQWFDEDIEVRNLKTRYGILNYSLKRLSNDLYEFSFGPVDAAIYLHLPFPFIFNERSYNTNFIKIDKGESKIRFKRYEKE